jgi:hypothetical protein
MSAAALNLTIEQGTDFEVKFTVRNKSGAPLNLLSYTATSSLRKHYTATSSYPFTVTFLDRANGRIALSMTDTTSATLSEGRYVYDVILTSPTGLKSRAIMGSVIVSPGVS